jgi:hypothetical protein
MSKLNLEWHEGYARWGNLMLSANAASNTVSVHYIPGPGMKLFLHSCPAGRVEGAPHGATCEEACEFLAHSIISHITSGVADRLIENLIGQADEFARLKDQCKAAEEDLRMEREKNRLLQEELDAARAAAEAGLKRADESESKIVDIIVEVAAAEPVRAMGRRFTREDAGILVRNHGVDGFLKALVESLEQADRARRLIFANADIVSIESLFPLDVEVAHILQTWPHANRIVRLAAKREGLAEVDHWDSAAMCALADALEVRWTYGKTNEGLTTHGAVPTIRLTVRRGDPVDVVASSIQAVIHRNGGSYSDLVLTGGSPYNPFSVDEPPKKVLEMMRRVLS